MAWKFVTVGTENDRTCIGDVAVWAHEWHRVPGAKATVVDPHYGQSFRFDVYRIRVADQVLEFAAGEFSNGVWGFYVDEGSGYAR